MTTTNTSRPASGTDVTDTVVSRATRTEKSAHGVDYLTTVTIRQDYADVPENGIYAGRSYKRTERYISNTADHVGQFIGSGSEPWTDEPAAAEQRVCVTCDEPVWQTGDGFADWTHADVARDADHQAAVKLAHPMDLDPFAGLDAEDDEADAFTERDLTPFRSDREADAVAGILAGLAEIEQPGRDTRTCWMPGDQEHDHEMCNDVIADERAADEPVFPPAEPEPSMSLAQFQQRVANGDWNGTTPAPVAPNPHQQSSYGTTILAALGLRGRHVYGGTVTYRTKQDRRARNRRSRATRKINRGR